MKQKVTGIKQNQLALILQKIIATAALPVLGHVYNVHNKLHKECGMHCNGHFAICSVSLEFVQTRRAVENDTRNERTKKKNTRKKHNEKNNQENMIKPKNMKKKKNKKMITTMTTTT